MIGYDHQDAYKYSVGVDGVEMSALPEAPMTAASQPKHCKSKETKKYSETIKSVAHFVVVTIFVFVSN